jgi:uncharacterized RDD family membrane protein YckC
MKCPKCSYLGFETGDRCKNCGYDFSLLPAADVHASEPHLEYDADSDLIRRDSDPDLQSSEWLDEVDTGLSKPPYVQDAVAPRMALAEEPRPAIPPAAKSGLPLFSRASAHDDEPLVRLPAEPRQPLAVRRTPDTPRLPSISKEVRRQTPDRDHVLLFGEEPDPAAKPRIEWPQAEPAHTRTLIESSYVEPPKLGLQASGVSARIVAALIDHGILLVIDLVVVYFTLRMASLSLGDWRLLPAVPLLAFLGMVKLAYFSAFTAVGGQTIGKMAAGIRVIADDAGSLDISRAIQRAAAVLVSLSTLGIGFLPALFGSDRRALHDRVAHTRVVTLPSA